MNEEFYKTKREQGLYRTYWDIYPKLLKKIKFNEDEKVLDAGCGNGELARYLKSRRLYGFDSDSTAVKIAKKKGYKKVIKSDIYKLPFKNKEFDKTICVEVIEYLAHPEIAFRELKRVTKEEVIISAANFRWYKLKSLFSMKWRRQYKDQLKMNKNFIDSRFLKRVGKMNSVQVKIIYVSNKFDLLRNLFGDWLASEVVAIYRLK